jgi:hypothetical protein
MSAMSVFRMPLLQYRTLLVTVTDGFRQQAELNNAYAVEIKVSTIATLRPAFGQNPNASVTPAISK